MFILHYKDNSSKSKMILMTLLFFFLAGLCEIGGGYLVWLWLREDMSWMIGALGGFVLFLYAIVPTFQPSHFHRIYAAYSLSLSPCLKVSLKFINTIFVCTICQILTLG